MESCPEKRPAAAAGILLLLILLSSCTPEQVLVVSDPFIDSVQGRTWGPSSTWFRFKARLSGIKVIHARSDQDNNLNSVLEAVNPRGPVVISPWNAVSLNRVTREDLRFIVAGAAPAETLIPQTVYITPDRSEALSEIGKIAADAAVSTGTDALALFNATTELRRREKNILTGSFESAAAAAGSTVRLIVRDIAAEGTPQLPSDFEELSDSASVLLLFAGTFNLKAMKDSGNASVPVITESLGESDAWKDRIIASVEDDPGAMNRVLLSKLTSEAADDQLYYPARLVKGDLFGSQRR